MTDFGVAFGAMEFGGSTAKENSRNIGSVGCFKDESSRSDKAWGQIHSE